MQPLEIIEVDEDTGSVGCDGGGGALGHPLVYYTFGTRGQVDCGYCGRRFVKRQAAHAPVGSAPAATAAGPAS